ncbi:BICD1-like protein [Mya arenaria]|uniref:BICD1-like protein n=2 Tax=Mya arenaria TaxID=6604 RepID=A0ABY7FW64_MYAAR|nr:protein bicaudal D-like isoform X1 [Mya arenaria]XP_052779955.1 protein bicaudal D-like isoform X1 [Mya arenaria]WAR25862.1 BICD1-like protein [Mya arenaria]
MSDLDVSSFSLEDLKVEIGRLQQELTETNQEKIRAAEYGLAVLEERNHLESKIEELDAQVEALKIELEHAKEALSKHQVTFRKQNESGNNLEDSIIQESASREDGYRENITELESELKNVKQNKERLFSEHATMASLVSDLQTKVDQLEDQRRQLKSELKEFKIRENRNMIDYSELEEENITLQKQVLVLKQSQVEYEGLKHEKKRLEEELDDLNMQLDESVSLKKIVDKNLEEALNALQVEREQKHALKKELDTRLTQESMFNLSNLAQLGGLSDGLRLNSHDDHDMDDDSHHPTLKRVEADMESKDKSGQSTRKGPGKVNDILSEIQQNEVKKLEQLLEQSEEEKSEMQRALDEAKKLIEDTQKDLIEQKDRANQLKSQISNALGVNGSLPSPESDVAEFFDKKIAEESDQEKKALLELKKNLLLNENKYSTALKQIGDLQTEISKLMEKNIQGNFTPGDPKVTESLTLLQSKCKQYEDAIKEMDRDLRVFSKIAGESQSSLNTTQDEMVKVTEELAQLYHLVCEVSGETPSRVMLQHAKAIDKITKPDSRDGSEEADEEGTSPEKDSVSGKKKKSKAKKTSLEILDNTLKADASSCSKLTETILDQTKHLKKSVEHLMEVSRNRTDDSEQSDVQELQEQIVKLKAMLSTKREQIATLRSVLKANKATAEFALANLKQKYENEKVIVTETMMKLRNELKALKEDAATFASLRAMFAQRCDEYVTQLDEYQRQLAAAEEEKKTLNSLLRMAIQQKLALTQRLEDMEFDRERRTMRRPQGGGGGRNKSGASKVSHYNDEQSYSGRYGGGRHQNYQTHHSYSNPRRDY